MSTSIERLIQEIQTNNIKFDELCVKFAGFTTSKNCTSHGYLYSFLVGLLILIVIGLTTTVYHFGVYSEKILQLEDIIFQGKTIVTEVQNGKR